MNIKNREKELKKIAEQALIKKAAEAADQQAADSEDYSNKIFEKLIDSIKIEGLED